MQKEQQQQQAVWYCNLILIELISVVVAVGFMLKMFVVNLIFIKFETILSCREKSVSFSSIFLLIYYIFTIASFFRLNL